MSLRGWETLFCDCGNDRFHNAVKVTWHEGQGTAIKADGLTCTGCGKRTDTGRMIERAKVRVLNEKIAELESQRHV